MRNRLRGVLAFGGSAIAGLLLLHLFRISSSKDQLPGVLTEQGLSPWNSVLPWILWGVFVPVITVLMSRSHQSHPETPGCPPVCASERPSGRRSVVLVAIAVAVLALPTQYYHAPLLSLFEAGHPLGAAWEFSNGKIPFRDFVPVHGWLEDGGFEAVGKGLGLVAADMLTYRFSVQAVGVVLATFALGIAVLEQLPWAAGAAALLLLLSRGHPLTRSSLPLIGLAIVAFGFCSRRSGLVILGAAVTAGTVFAALEFGLYSLAAELLAGIGILAFSREPLASKWLGLTAAGAALGALPFIAYLAWHGAFLPFLYESFWRLPHVVDQAYGQPPIDPVSWRIANWLSPAARFVIDPALASACLVSSLSRLKRGARDGAPLLLVSCWSLLAYRSVTERLHIYYLAPGIAVLTAYCLRAAWRRLDRSGWPVAAKSAVAAAAMAILAVFAGRVLNAPETMRIAVGSCELFAHPGGVPPELANLSLPVPSRCLIPQDQAKRLVAVKKFLDARIGPDQTFVDFANQPGLHYFVGRSNPLPYYEVPLLEDAYAQSWAIRSIDLARTPLVLQQWGEPAESTVDGLPNRKRAPLLWEYLRKAYPREITAAGCVWRTRED